MTREEFDSLTETEQNAALAKLETEAPARPGPLWLCIEEKHPAFKVPSVMLVPDGEVGVHLQMRWENRIQCVDSLPDLADLAAWVREAQRALGQGAIEATTSAAEDSRARQLADVDYVLGLPREGYLVQARRLEAIRALQSDLTEVIGERDRLQNELDELASHVAVLHAALELPAGFAWPPEGPTAQDKRVKAARQIVAARDELSAEVARLRARVAELGEGLRPFAEQWSKLYDVWGGANDSDVLVAEPRGDVNSALRATVGDLRRAAELLGEPEPAPPCPPNVCRLCRKVWPVGTGMGPGNVCPSGSCAEAPAQEPDLPPAWEKALEATLGVCAYAGCWCISLCPGRGAGQFRWALHKGGRHHGWTLVAQSQNVEFVPDLRAALIAALAACPQAREAADV